MKKLLFVLAVGISSSIANACESKKLVIEATKKAVEEFSELPGFLNAKDISNYVISNLHNGDESKQLYSIAALDKKGAVIALGSSSVDLPSCELTTNPDGSVANSLSFKLSIF